MSTRPIEIFGELAISYSSSVADEELLRFLGKGYATAHVKDDNSITLRVPFNFPQLSSESKMSEVIVRELRRLKVLPKLGGKWTIGTAHLSPRRSVIYKERVLSGQLTSRVKTKYRQVTVRPKTPKKHQPVGTQSKSITFHSRLLEASVLRKHYGIKNTLTLEDIQSVYVIVGSSRGGTSYLHSFLSQFDHLAHLPGESETYLKVCALLYPDATCSSDRMDSSTNLSLREEFAKQMLSDLGNASRYFLSEIDITSFALDIYQRLLWQWVDIEFSYELIEQKVREGLHILHVQYGWSERAFEDVRLFYLTFLRLLRKAYPAINLYYYDLDPRLIKTFMPEVVVPLRPLTPHPIEETPFILSSPWTRASSKGVRGIVIKSPNNAYRLKGFIDKLYPNATIKVIHLTRNFFDSVNGLMKGWNSPHFCSHRFQDRTLQLKGYTDRNGAWARHSWKYDRFPVYELFHKNATLRDVCAEQWISSHREILAYRKVLNDEQYLKISFEQLLIRDPSTLERLLSFIGASYQKVATDLPLSAPTSRHRWEEDFVMKKSARLSEVRMPRAPRFKRMMEKLGYECSSENGFRC